MAIEVLRQTGVDIVGAALSTKTALEAGRGRVKRAVECITTGAETLRSREKTVTFERGVLEALDERKDRRKRTLMDFLACGGWVSGHPVAILRGGCVKNA